MWKKTKTKTKLLSFIVTSLLLFMCLAGYSTISSEQRVVVGQQLDFELTGIPKQILSKITIHLTGSTSNDFLLNGQELKENSFQLMAGNPVATKPGKIKLQYKLFNKIPIKKISLNVIPQYQVYPGGQSIGVLLQSKGVQVVGYSPVYSNDVQFFPAKDAGIREGDYLIKINNEYVNSDLQLAQIIDRIGATGETLSILVKQGEKQKVVEVKPQFCQDTKRYRIGLFVRDTTAGVGTMSFYDNVNQVYGALGHVITDNETNKMLDINKGKIVSAVIKGIEIGRKGQPGEKIGIIQDESLISGTIEKNTHFGIFGKLKDPIKHSLYQEPIPVALANQIFTGKAQILTVITENKIEPFEIEIERIYSQKKPGGKGMVVRITDERLLQATGGIVQGMSGSPIIQNGMLVGVVTHVFINDPTRGYGILAEWMLMEVNLISRIDRQFDKKVEKINFFVFLA